MQTQYQNDPTECAWLIAVTDVRDCADQLRWEQGKQFHECSGEYCVMNNPLDFRPILQGEQLKLVSRVHKSSSYFI